MMIDGKTRTLGLLGDPVEHTMSPLIHNTLSEKLGLNNVYVPFHTKAENLEAAVKGAYALNILGLNVTVPHKNEVMQYLSELDEGGQAIGAVNTLVRTENGYKGYSYMQDHTKEAGRAFDAHSKDKDSFYSKKCKKDELNELWERD